MIHFDHAGKLEQGEAMEPDANLKHAKETIGHFLEP